MEGYISGLCQKFGLSPTDKASSPSDKDLFQDTSYMPAVDVTLYQKVIGGLIYVLKNRSDVRKEVIFLATKTANPNMGDLIKCIRVLKYLNTTRTLGPTYYTDEGVVLYGCVDAAYGVHADGRSQTGYFISIGRYSAPICCYTSAQNACISLSSMEAEYVALSELGKKIIHFRHILDELGFKQTQPTIIFEDNKSAIKLANNIQVTRKSRHINIRHHYIRDIIKKKEVIIVHLPSHLMTSDMLTKPLGPTTFKPFCRILLNVEHYFAGPLRNNILVDPPKPINQHLEKPLKNDRQMKGSMHDQPNIINISKIPQKSTTNIHPPATHRIKSNASTKTFIST
jgi:virulence-associated protein VapD